MALHPDTKDTVRGFAFPFRFTPTGGVAQQAGDDKLRENIVQLLLTGVGERVMRRDYGGGLRQILHDPNNDALRAIVARQIGKAITVHEPRVLVEEVRVQPDPEDDATLLVDVRFVVRRTRQTATLSVPIGLDAV